MTLSDALAIVGATLGTTSFMWSLEAFRRSGARIRVRALYNNDSLDLAVVNAGRAADAVVHVFLGGVRVGDGLELNGPLSPELSQPLSPATPFAVEAATPLLARVALGDVATPHLLRRATAGFESVHVSLGSLSAVRADVVPVSRLKVAAAWSPRPLVSRVRRFGPLAGAVTVCAATQASPGAVDSVRSAIFGVGVLIFFAYLWSSRHRETYARARLERWATNGMLLAALLWTGALYVPTGASSTGPELLLAVLLLVGILFAVPTAIAVLWSGCHHAFTRVRPSH